MKVKDQVDLSILLNITFIGMLRVILDTNFLVLPLEERIDVLDQIRDLLGARPIPILLLESLEEALNKCVSSSPSERRLFKSALNLLDNIAIESSGIIQGKVDERILQFSIRRKAIVATNDKELRKRLRSLGVTVLYFREGKRRIEIEGAVL
ncbi:hypothetical protein DRN89_01115 [archaeon]|nr:MAG: hypothetical protein DRN89_01115 [archaeon]